MRNANSRSIWLTLTDAFPHPYTEGDAEAWIARMEKAEELPTSFAVRVEGEPVGGIGFSRREKAESRLTASVGCWIGEAYWGRGLATDALRQVVRYAFNRFDFERLEAMVIEGNRASCRVLEKNGFALEGRLRRSIVKAGEVRDSWIYSRLRGREDTSAA